MIVASALISWKDNRPIGYSAMKRTADKQGGFRLSSEEGAKNPPPVSPATAWPDTIVESLNIPLLLLDGEFRILNANPAFRRFFHCQYKDIAGCSLFELAEAQTCAPPLRELLTSVMPLSVDQNAFNFSHEFPTIGFRSLVVNLHKVGSHTGNSDRMLLCLEDITPYTMAEKSLAETERQLELALQSGSVGTWIWEIKKNQVIVSRVSEKVYGSYTSTMLKDYAEWEKGIHPGDVDITRRAVQHSLDTGSPLDIEFRMYWPDKSLHWLLAKALPYYDQYGEAERMMGVHVDITERRIALEESERLFQIMSDHAPVMIWIAGADARINFVNRAWTDFTGREREDAIGDGWQEGIHPEDTGQTLKTLKDAFTARGQFRAEFRLKRRDGAFRWLLTHGSPRFTREGAFNGFMGTCMDITDRKDLERQKDDFMSIASHELKTPVTSIKAYTQILQERFGKRNDVESTTMMTRLDLQVDKLAGLINTLLDVARIQSGQMDYVKEWFHLAALIREVAEETERIWPQQRIVIDLAADPIVFGDLSRISQVLTNLLSNAAKYSPSADKIIVKTFRRADEVVVSVRDFGVGIPPDMQEKVFARFFRASTSNGDRVSGLGLGLYISYQIIEAHGGKLWLESKPGQGSEFFFSLPLTAPAS